jgi:hypothetical protein
VDRAPPGGDRVALATPAGDGSATGSGCTLERMATGALRREPERQRATRIGPPDSTQEDLMNERTQLQSTVERQHVGRFSEGIEQLADTPDKRRIGRFSEGFEQQPQTPSKLHRGRFSEGMEQLPQTPSKLRRGSFADGYAAVR